MPAVIDLLINKGNALRSVPSQMTVLDATKVMNQHLIGAVVVMEDDRIAGIFTERDVLRRVVAVGLDPARTTVSQVMTTPVITCRPELSLEDCATLMTTRRVRHLPVQQGSELTGLVTIGDLLAHKVSEQQATLEQMTQYLYDVR